MKMAEKTALLNKRFRTVASAVRAIKQAEQQWWKSLPKDDGQRVRRKQKPGDKARR
jgi:hypothetical protein